MDDEPGTGQHRGDHQPPAPAPADGERDQREDSTTAYGTSASGVNASIWIQVPPCGSTARVKVTSSAGTSSARTASQNQTVRARIRTTPRR